MIAIITGDIINSRKVSDSEVWLSALKSALNFIDKKNWEIYRGDSFQLKVKPEDALMDAIYIKAALKTIKALDIRIAIGVGEEGKRAKQLGQSNGEAFVLSGSAVETLKKDKMNMAVRSSQADFDEEINTGIRLALTFTDNWGPATAAMVKAAIEYSDLPQQELAARMGKTQSSVSEALKRAHFAELKELDALYRKKLSKFNGQQ